MLTQTNDHVASFEWDECWYVRRYSDVAEAFAQGHLTSPIEHYLQFGCREGRFPSQAAEDNARILASKASGGSSPRVAVGASLVPLDWPVRGEVRKTFGQRLINGFFGRYMSGSMILDIGYRGAHSDAVPILPHAIGIDLDYPGYDGHRLPFAPESIDSIFASHLLEHVENSIETIRDWFRVTKIGGFIVCIVPHQYLYERNYNLPSRWSAEHRRFYTPASLVHDFERSLEPNSYRIRHLADNDHSYQYHLDPMQHPAGCYEIELVVEKIQEPVWKLGELSGIR